MCRITAGITTLVMNHQLIYFHQTRWIVYHFVINTFPSALFLALVSASANWVEVAITLVRPPAAANYMLSKTKCKLTVPPDDSITLCFVRNLSRYSESDMCCV
jgi:hypothetical protein